MTDNKIRKAIYVAIGVMIDDPENPYRQGYTFANAVNAAAELHDLDRLEEAIVAEALALEIARRPREFSIFNPDNVSPFA